MSLDNHSRWLSRWSSQTLTMPGCWHAFRRPCQESWLAVLVFFTALVLCSATVLHAEESSSGKQSVGQAIYPVWKLLTREQKMQFVAGYVQGWKDASKVTDIAIGFVRDNPNEAVSGLEKLKSLYDLSDVSPSLITTQLDGFFARTENQSASLSLAISTARSGLR